MCVTPSCETTLNCFQSSGPAILPNSYSQILRRLQQMLIGHSLHDGACERCCSFASDCCLTPRTFAVKAGLGADLLLRLTPREAAVDSDYCNTKCPKFSGEDLVATKLIFSGNFGTLCIRMCSLLNIQRNCEETSNGARQTGLQNVMRSCSIGRQRYSYESTHIIKC